MEQGQIKIIPKEKWNDNVQALKVFLKKNARACSKYARDNLYLHIGYYYSKEGNMKKKVKRCLQFATSFSEDYPIIC